MTLVNIDSHSLHVSSGNRAHCDRCALKGGCGQQLLASLTGGERNVLALPRALVPRNDLCRGDVITLALDDGHIARASLLVYLLPLALALAATALATWLAAGEGWVIVSAVLALVAGQAAVGVIGPGLGRAMVNRLDISHSRHPARQDADSTLEP